MVPPARTGTRARAGGRGAGAGHTGSVGQHRLRRFLHFGHVFKSAFAEVLEAQYLSEVGPPGMTVAQLHLLKIVALKRQQHVGEVARLLGVSSPAVSKCIARLEGMGLVTRARGRGDRRFTLLSASRDGSELVRRYEQVKAAHLVPVLGAMDRADVDALTALLERFATVLYQAEGARTGFCLRCAAYGDADCPIAPLQQRCPYRAPGAGVPGAGVPGSGTAGAGTAGSGTAGSGTAGARQRDAAAQGAGQHDAAAPAAGARGAGARSSGARGARATGADDDGT